MPFLEPRHRSLAARVDAFADRALRPIEHHEDDVDALALRLLAALGAEGLLAATVPAGPDFTGPLDVRALCVVRERLARRMGLADFAFAMQGLGSYPVVLAGTAAQRQEVLRGVIDGSRAMAFALTEPEAGSDAAAIACRAERRGDRYVLTGHKRFISNATVFGAMTLFARTGAGNRGISAFLVPPGLPGLRVVPQTPMAPHPLGELLFDGAELPVTARLGEEGAGLKLALATLDVFRTTVAAAALGFAVRAQEEAIAHVQQRRQFGATLAELPAVQALIAENEVELEASRLLVYRAAATKDGGAARVTREAAIAKYYATEAAQRIVDRSLQLHGGLGVLRGTPVERLYREVRALRIYEGASEIQRLVIARERLGRAG